MLNWVCVPPGRRELGQMVEDKPGGPGEEASSGRRRKAGMEPERLHVSERSEGQPKGGRAGLCSFKSNAQSVGSLLLLAHRSTARSPPAGLESLLANQKEPQL